ncbi:MAG: EAL domain-containing protein [Anaerovibrio sp.]|uniref:putative bifunctional diguanylate cyclase/phosphodiesterase n=1 Tax=Anaerovibrio sp. TaxID=1872532 RepID=UPI0025B9B12A|nr:EAL domain-containing response regulator [Anaerovibrio sp.]MBE6099221.1 EAL domain-containing protein [Anaerovibrio sp.]
MTERTVMLIVDDVEINRAILSQFFQNEYEILEASNGEEALEILESRNVDIMLLDLMMPVMNGMEVLGVLHKNPRFSHIPVIVTTSQDVVNSEVQALENGAADYITKPYNPIIVKIRVRNVMARQENEWRKVRQKAQADKISEMQNIIEIDQLTGLYNHQTIMTKASKMVQENRSVRYCIVYLDISCFKVINEMFNMETGDMILKTAADYFKTVAGRRGLAARLSADQFALCVPEDTLDMELVIQGLDAVMRSLAVYRSIMFYAGVFVVDNVYLSVNKMLDRAHMAMNTVKGNYNKRYAYYDEELRTSLMEEQMLVRDMEGAMDNNNFCIYLQPIYNIDTNKIVSAETLIRWHHPQKGLMSPSKFIHVFEKNGFVTRLDRFAWGDACRFLSRQRDNGLEVVPISVNVSRINMYDQSFVDYMQSLLAKYDLEPWMLRIEITESAYMDNPAQLVKVLKKLKNAGFTVLMDDFGSGYSSLNILKDLTVDVLKLDMKFIQNFERSSRASIIMESVVQMAHNLGIDTVVEGVETETQVEFLKEIGCNVVQGYYYAKPMSTEECLDLLINEQ